MNLNTVGKVCGILASICGVLILVLSWTANRLDTRTLAEGIFLVAIGIFTFARIQNKK